MARAYLASTSTSSTSTLTTTTVPLSTPTLVPSIAYKTPPVSFLDRIHPYLLATPFAALFDLRPADARRHGLNKGSERHNARMDLSIGPGAHWLSRLRSCLRLLIIVLSGAVVCMLMHTFEIYRGNRYLDLRRGELPMTWPAHTNLAPTIILFVVAAANFLASVAILTLSFKRSFRRPFRSRDIYRIVAGSFSVIMWLTALVAFNLLDKASKASLGRYSCTNASIPSNGRYQYRAVCEEQGVAFYTAMGAAFAETITLVTLAISAILSVKHPEPQPTIRIREKNNSISSGSKFLKPIKRATP